LLFLLVVFAVQQQNNSQTQASQDQNDGDRVRFHGDIMHWEEAAWQASMCVLI